MSLLVKELGEAEKSKETIESEYKEHLLDNLLYYTDKYKQLVKEDMMVTLIDQ